MRNLFIHAGLAKTGTTSIQRYFTRNRRAIRDLGFDYPDLCVSESGEAHHNISDEIMNHKKFDPTQGSIRDMQAYLAAPHRLQNIVLSSEGLATCIANKQKLPEFVKFLKSARDTGYRLYLIIMFRKFEHLIKLRYLQKLKTGQLDQELEAFVDENVTWFGRLFLHMKGLERMLGNGVFVPIDLAMGESDAVAHLKAFVGLPDSELLSAPQRSNERFGLKKIAVLDRFQRDPDGKLISRPTREVLQLATRLRRMPPFPDDKFNYRILPVRLARRIQKRVHKSLPPRWLAELGGAARLDVEPYDVADLSSVMITSDEIEQILEKLPTTFRAEFQASSLAQKDRARAHTHPMADERMA